MVLYLRYNPAEMTERTWPPVDSAELLFGGEYVMIGDTPYTTESADNASTAEADPEPAPAAPPVESTENSGTPSPQPTPPLTSERPSPAKANPTPPATPTGPSKAEIEAAERARREQETRDAIASKVTFGKSGGKSNSQGKPGQPDGNSATGAASGTPGYNLNGRTIASWKTPPGAPLGTITVAVSVDREGNVTSAVYSSGTGAAAASETARAQCVAAARGSKFSVDYNAPKTQRGTITYHFR